jgi:thymidine kinase
MLTVVTGPMFAGKTSKLISMCLSNVVAGNRVVVFKPTNDNRYDGSSIVSHNLDKFASVSIGYNTPKDVFKVIDDMADKAMWADVVFFDEVQFFSSEIIEVVEYILSMRSIKEVVCGGLAQDTFGKPFGSMPHLLSIADNIIMLKAVCSFCKKIDMASRTFRKIKTKEQVVVGGADLYQAACFNCWSAWRGS